MRRLPLFFFSPFPYDTNMNTVLLCLLAVLIFLSVPATMYIVFIKLGGYRRSIHRHSFPASSRYPRTPLERGRYGTHTTFGNSYLNPMNARGAPGATFLSSMWIQAPPAALRQMSRLYSTNRFSNDVEAGGLRDMFIGVGQMNAPGALTYHTSPHVTT
ncbi:hypothetical protein C8R43DRAFT_985704 [Mycena crocata]|nr:hypothetical protein C8R43DRAFT_985704 [Mycena crocata]